VVLAPLLMVLEVCMDLLQPTLMSEIVDIGVANGDIGYILRRGGVMLLCALLGAVGGMGCTVASSVAGMGFGTNMRTAIYDKVQSFSFRELDQLKTSSLITRITNDVTQIQNMFMMALRMLVRAPLLLFGGMFMALRISPRLSLIFLASMPVLLIGAAVVMKKAFPLFGVMQERIDRSIP
jgi:ATP-binding cassette subfamily B protein